MIRVSSYPIRDSYDTLDEAVAANDRAPLQARARADTQLLGGAELSAHAWTDTSCSLHFSNGRSLVVYVAEHEIDWGVSDAIAKPPMSHPPTSGDPIILSWSELGEGFEFEPNALLCQLHGSEFQQLYYIADLGRLALYTRGNEILSFSVLRREDTGHDMLYSGWLG